MNDEHLNNAIEFLSRIAVGRIDEQRLIDTVNALAIELKRRKHERHQRVDPR